ncbi:MAG: hypothetical protein GWP08_02600, partial [Nitrospiraceae bacterium]|nr:hypothetical protein [Nitrospiraceae bacterium]
MLRLSVCVEMFWGGTEFPLRIQRVASLGFEAFEFWGWWDKDVDAIERAAKDAGVAVASCCVKTSFSGDVPSMLLPGGEEPFVASV